MTAELHEREAAALKSLQIAETWRGKLNPRMELTCLLSGTTSLLSCSVTFFDDSSSGIEYLRSHEVAAFLKRLAVLNEQLYESFLESGTPQAAVNNSITPVHLAWLIGEWDAAAKQVAICVDPRVSKCFPLTPFWAEYHRGIQSLATGDPYDAALPRPRGYEKYWALYLRLISDLTHKRDDSEGRSELGQAFAKRNCDNRLVDWQMIDGDGKHPTRWDFRAASILAFWNHTRGIID